MDRTLEELSRIGEEDAVIFNFDQVQAVAAIIWIRKAGCMGMSRSL